jgi:hypothetical protein
MPRAGPGDFGLRRRYAFEVVLPPWIFEHVPAGTKIHELGSLACFDSPAQECEADAQSFRPAALTPKHFSA